MFDRVLRLIQTPWGTSPKHRLAGPLITDTTGSWHYAKALLQWDHPVPMEVERHGQRETFWIERLGPQTYHAQQDKQLWQLRCMSLGEPVPSLNDTTMRVDKLRDPRHYVIGIWDNQHRQLIGCGFMSPLKDFAGFYGRPHTVADVGFLGNLMVHPDYQGLGLAKRMLGQSLQAASAFGFRHVVLFSNHPKMEGTAQQAGILEQFQWKPFAQEGDRRWYSRSLDPNQPLTSHQFDQLRVALKALPLIKREDEPAAAAVLTQQSAV